jgi:hypothetical protein
MKISKWTIGTWGLAFVVLHFAFVSTARAVDTPAAKPVATKAYADNDVDSPQLELIDVPTADVLDPATYSTNFRFYSEGGIVSRLVIGPFRRVNFGIMADAQQVIGGSAPHLIRPSLYFKLRAFDGTDILPAIALGYDNEGYLYSNALRDFQQQAKGLYLVASHEIFLPNFDVHAGMNTNEFDPVQLYGFFGVGYRVVDNLTLMAEYDNIRNGEDNRVNLGGRFWVTSYFNVDVASRNVGRGEARGAERIIKLNYVSRFPTF